MIEQQGQLLFYTALSDKLEDKHVRIFWTLSLFIACSRTERHNEMDGHMRASKTYNNAKRF